MTPHRAPRPRMLRASNASPMTLDGTRTFLVGRARPVVIDPGPDEPAHLRALEAELAGARPAAILLTHAHPDHAAGAEALAHRTGAPVWMSAGALAPAIDPALIGRWISDGEAVETDAGPLLALATPGHTPEHLAFWWPDARALFVGDLLMGSGDTTLVAPPEGELAAYLRSLERVDRLEARVLYPAHGPPLAEPREAVARYRRHRESRIEQVMEALRGKPAASAAELRDAVYGTALHPRLLAAAEGSLHAILRYLAEMGRIDPAGEGRYTPRDTVPRARGDPRRML